MHGPRRRRQLGQLVRIICRTQVEHPLRCPAETGKHSEPGRQQQLARFGGTTIRAVNLVTTEDPHELTQLPTTPQRVHYQVWLAVPAPASFGT